MHQYRSLFIIQMENALGKKANNKHDNGIQQTDNTIERHAGTKQLINIVLVSLGQPIGEETDIGGIKT
jgi:hypothetical protein